MTPDEIIKMAMKAGVAPMMTNKPVMYPSLEALETFAALIAAREREACAQVVEAIDRNGAWVTKAEAAAAIRARSKQ